MLKIIISILILFSISSCSAIKISPHDKENETPLKYADKYYKYIMWKSYDRAASFVHPEKTKLYTEMVRNNKKDLNITSYEISESIILPPENEEIEETQVNVILTYYKYPSVTEKTATVSAIWYKIEDDWFIKPDFDSEIFKE